MKIQCQCLLDHPRAGHTRPGNFSTPCSNSALREYSAPNVVYRIQVCEACFQYLIEQDKVRNDRDNRRY